MLGVHEKSVTVVQVATDALTVETVDLKVNLEANEYMLPRRVEVSLDPADVLDWVPPCTFRASVSDPAGTFTHGRSLALQVGGVIESRYIIDIAHSSPVYADRITITVDTLATSIQNEVKLRFVYEVFQGTELGYTQSVF